MAERTMPGRLNQAKPKILILADAMPVGGAERQIVELLKGLKSRGSFFTILGILVKGGALQSEATRFADFFLPFPQKSEFDVTLAFSVYQSVKKYNIALIHTFGIISDIAGLFAAKTLGIPYINGSMRSAPPRLNHRDIINRCCMPFADMAIANSYAGLRAFKMIKHPRAQVIYNGVDLSRFENVRPIKQATSNICMVGNFTKRKDQAGLIRSLPLIRQVFPNIKLLLIGKKRKKFAKCHHLIKSLGLDANVDIISDTDHPEPYILGSYVTVLITNIKIHGEGISNAIIEYMALGKPVVASDCGGNKELVEHGKTGYLIPANTPLMISEYILKLLCNPEKAKHKGALGKKKIFSQFGLERMIDEYEGLYLKFLK
ncbi:glycosyltransferase family 4 protein [Desulfococcaceae bacterium HSG7]|nr:glycosyltransferase family 4 protein [Desulfococcaceae bacterium HSG7]